MVECIHCRSPVTGGAVMCPYYKEQPICQTHCRECKHHYEYFSGEIRCGYYLNKKLPQFHRRKADPAQLTAIP